MFGARLTLGVRARIKARIGSARFCWNNYISFLLSKQNYSFLHLIAHFIGLYFEVSRACEWSDIFDMFSSEKIWAIIRERNNQQIRIHF